MRKSFVVLFAFTVWLSGVSKADSLYTLTMNTSALAGSGQFTLDFQFNDSTGLPVDLNNNRVTLSSFNFNGGNAVGAGSTTGSASGSIASGIALTDAQFFNEYMQNFTAGSQLSFNIDVTNVLDSSHIPDLFTFAILDSSQNELPTNGPANEFLDVSLTGGSSPQVSTFGSSAFSIPKPVVQEQSIVSTPEPSAFWLLLSGGYILKRPLRRVR